MVVLRVGEKYGSRKNGERKQRARYMREKNRKERTVLEREVSSFFAPNRHFHIDRVRDF